MYVCACAHAFHPSATREISRPNALGHFGRCRMDCRNRHRHAYVSVCVATGVTQMGDNDHLNLHSACWSPRAHPSVGRSAEMKSKMKLPQRPLRPFSPSRLPLSFRRQIAREHIPSLMCAVCACVCARTVSVPNMPKCKFSSALTRSAAARARVCVRVCVCNRM